MDQQKLNFLETEFPAMLASLQPDEPSRWGKMNAQQMIEHVADFFKVSSGKLKFPLVTPEEQLPKYMEFLYSDKQFRENTRGPVEVLPDEPFTERNPDMASAIDELVRQIHYFKLYFEKEPDAKTLHPVFGWLGYNEWILLHYKHVTHHLRQFGLL